MRYFNKYDAQDMAETWVEKVLDDEKSYSVDELGKMYGLTPKQVDKVCNFLDTAIKEHDDVDAEVGEVYEADCNGWAEIYEPIPCGFLVEFNGDDLYYHKDGGYDWAEGRVDWREVAAEKAYEAQREEYLINSRG